MKFAIAGLAALSVALPANIAAAWGNVGHRYSGWVADEVMDQATRSKVHAILGYDLGAAAIWADCAKHVDKVGSDFVWRPSTRERQTCAAFASEAEVDRMEDYVRRNWTTCGAAKSCHNKYHYANIAIQRSSYAEGQVGAQPYDIVHVINAAIAFIETGEQQRPFSIKDKKEAILLLAHFVTDLHQPLHAGSIYLDQRGHLVDPDGPGGFTRDMETVGGNIVYMGTQPMHSSWDGVLDDYEEAPTAEMLALARATGPTTGDRSTWSTAWATDSLAQAQAAFADLTFGKSRPYETRYGPEPGWPAYYQPGLDYNKRRREIQRVQLAKGGARLAQVLEALDSSGFL